MIVLLHSGSISSGVSAASPLTRRQSAGAQPMSSSRAAGSRAGSSTTVGSRITVNSQSRFSMPSTGAAAGGVPLSPTGVFLGHLGRCSVLLGWRWVMMKVDAQLIPLSCREGGSTAQRYFKRGKFCGTQPVRNFGV